MARADRRSGGAGDERRYLAARRRADRSRLQPAHRLLLRRRVSRGVTGRLLRDLAVIMPHPAAHVRWADKRLLAWLRDENLLAQAGLDAAERAAVVAAIPPTEIVEPEAADDLWARRKTLFFKPVDGYAGKAAYRGDKLTRAAFEHIRANPYVAQAIAPTCFVASAPWRGRSWTCAWTSATSRCMGRRGCARRDSTVGRRLISAPKVEGSRRCSRCPQLSDSMPGSRARLLSAERASVYLSERRPCLRVRRDWLECPPRHGSGSHAGGSDTHARRSTHAWGPDSGTGRGPRRRADADVDAARRIADRRDGRADDGARRGHEITWVVETRHCRATARPRTPTATGACE